MDEKKKTTTSSLRKLLSPGSATPSADNKNSANQILVEVGHFPDTVVDTVLSYTGPITGLMLGKGEHYPWHFMVKRDYPLAYKEKQQADAFKAETGIQSDITEMSWYELYRQQTNKAYEGLEPRHVQLLIAAKEGDLATTEELGDVTDFVFARDNSSKTVCDYIYLRLRAWEDECIRMLIDDPAAKSVLRIEFPETDLYSLTTEALIAAIKKHSPDLPIVKDLDNQRNLYRQKYLEILTHFFRQFEPLRDKYGNGPWGDEIVVYLLEISILFMQDSRINAMPGLSINTCRYLRYYAINTGDLPIIEKVFDFTRHHIGRDDFIGETTYRYGTLCGKVPLYCAASRGYADVVKYLVRQGARIDSYSLVIANDKQIYAKSTLWAAVEAGDTAIVSFLLETGGSALRAPPSRLRSSFFKTPLHFAVGFGYLEIVKLIGEITGKNVLGFDSANHAVTPLMELAMQDHPDLATAAYLLTDYVPQFFSPIVLRKQNGSSISVDTSTYMARLRTLAETSPQFLLMLLMAETQYLIHHPETNSSPGRLRKVVGKVQVFAPSSNDSIQTSASALLALLEKQEKLISELGASKSTLQKEHPGLKTGKLAEIFKMAKILAKALAEETTKKSKAEAKSEQQDASPAGREEESKRSKPIAQSASVLSSSPPVVPSVQTEEESEEDEMVEDKNQDAKKEREPLLPPSIAGLTRHTLQGGKREADRVVVLPRPKNPGAGKSMLGKVFTLGRFQSKQESKSKFQPDLLLGELLGLSPNWQEKIPVSIGMFGAHTVQLDLGDVELGKAKELIKPLQASLSKLYPKDPKITLDVSRKGGRTHLLFKNVTSESLKPLADQPKEVAEIIQKICREVAPTASVSPK